LGFIGNALDLHAVGARVFVPGVQEPVNQRFFVAEQQQTLGVAVEPSNRIDILWQTKISERAMFRQFPGELGEHVVGFVKGNQHGAPSMADAPDDWQAFAIIRKARKNMLS
jgi:hypothetical protein